ncbi:MAG: acyl-CoA thioesterase II [Myxococcota bacterium]|nr:acyl-CoA thioesterase II [Myxococcota bacterium]
MTSVLDALIHLLSPAQTGSNTFVGQSQDLGWGTVFGGQVLGQALASAAYTVDPHRMAHSLHGYFLEPGHVDHPVQYTVERLRDGRSFSTRRVTAHQASTIIFTMTASFQIAEHGFEHTTTAPKTTDPTHLPSSAERAKGFARQLPEKIRHRALASQAIETRPVDPIDPFNPEIQAAEQYVWLRANGSVPSDPRIHQSLLAYASDFSFLTTALRPHGVSWLTPGIRMASLDHALWFHRPSVMTSWLLHAIDGPVSAGARALVRGQIFDRKGQLVASSSQEGMIRMNQWRGTPS